MTLDLSSKILDWQDCNGVWRQLSRCSLNNRTMLSHRYQQLLTYTGQLKDRENTTYVQLYCGDVNNPPDSKFKYFADECFKLCGIDPGWINEDLLVGFLFPHQREGGEISSVGLLFEFNFPEWNKQNKGKGGTISITELKGIIFKLSGQFKDLQYLINDVPYDELEDILKGIELASEDKEEKAKKEHKKQLLEKQNAMRNPVRTKFKKKKPIEKDDSSSKSDN